MVGQWAGDTIGLNTVCLMGRNLVRDLCKKDKKKFVTTKKNETLTKRKKNMESKQTYF